LKQSWKTEDEAKKEEFFVYKPQDLVVDLPITKRSVVLLWSGQREIMSGIARYGFSVPPGAQRSTTRTASPERRL